MRTVPEFLSFGLDTLRVITAHERKHKFILDAYDTAAKNGNALELDPDIDIVLTAIEIEYGSDPNRPNSWAVVGYDEMKGENEYIARKAEESVKLPKDDVGDWISGPYGKQWNNGEEGIK